MSEMTNAPTPHPDPMGRFETLGSKYCVGSPGFCEAEAEYHTFLKEIYGSSERCDALLGGLIESARNNTREGDYGAPMRVMRSVLGLLGPYTASFEGKKSIPWLVFAYCKEATAVCAAGMSGARYAGWAGYLLRASLLEKLSLQEVPEFCVERLRNAASFCATEDLEYVEKIARGEPIDISGLISNAQPQRSETIDPYMSMLLVPKTAPPPTASESVLQSAGVSTGSGMVREASGEANFGSRLSCARTAGIVTDDIYNQLNSSHNIEQAAARLSLLLEQARGSQLEAYQLYERMMSRIMSV